LGTNSEFLSKVNPEMLRHAYNLRDQVLLALDGDEAAGGKLVLTSCHPQEGVSTTAVALASALALANRWQVLLCDVNVDRPGLQRFIATEAARGLTDALAGECEPDEAVQPTPLPALHVLTAGSHRMHPSDVFSSGARVPFRDILERLAQRFQFMVFDAPPVLEYSATSVLAAMADGTILVIEAERERYEAAHSALRLLRSAGATVIGAVLNKRRFHIPGFLYRHL